MPDIARPLVGPEGTARLTDVLEPGRLGDGPVVRPSETAFGAFCGVDRVTTTVRPYEADTR